MQSHKPQAGKADSGCVMFGVCAMLACKCDWYGKALVKVDRLYPCSQLCSECGHQNTAAKDLPVREWACPECGVRHDRDINAAMNILREECGYSQVDHTNIHTVGRTGIHAWGEAEGSPPDVSRWVQLVEPRIHCFGRGELSRGLLSALRYAK